MRAIDADTLIKALVRKQPFNDCARVVIAECMEEVRHAPTIEPERKKGKWNFIGDNMFECTYCGVAYTTQQLNGLRNYNVDPYAPKFCPNCGADMRGDRNDRH